MVVVFAKIVNIMLLEDTVILVKINITVLVGNRWMILMFVSNVNVLDLVSLINNQFVKK